jgi:FAD dependent oxidoreductase
MHHSLAFRWLLTLLLLCLLTAGRLPGVSASDDTTDVCVYGATPGGIAAAVSAAKGGLRVTLIEPTNLIGGLVTNGLSNTDFRSFESLSGFFWEFARRVEQHYVKTYGANSEQVKAAWRGTHGEPKVNLLIFAQMLAEQNVRVIKAHSLQSLTTSDWQSGRRQITTAIFRNTLGRNAAGATLTVAAKMFIDGSYEGDLMALAGESYHVGREARAQYGEPLAGDVEGQADGQVQGYNFRFVMTKDPANKVMPQAPAGYNREDFVDVLPHFASGRLKKVFDDGHAGIYRAHLPLLPNGKADVNDTPRAPVRLSMPDINDAYPDADAATRQRIIAQHLYYNVGLLYFLQNDSAVPEAMRADARAWGWCKDEFTESRGIPLQLYIREARRMVGQYVFTGNDTKQATGDARSVLRPDSIAMGDYVHNCHGTGRAGTRFNGEHQGEFYLSVAPYQIPYGVIVPQKTTNLLVPVACSASHFGFSALRLEPIWASLGQAAGWATSLAVRESTPVQKVNVTKLQAHLHADRSATIYVSDVAPDAPDFAAVQWFALRGGLHGLAANNQPKAQPIAGQYSQAHPGHAAQLNQPLDEVLRARWHQLAPLPEATKPQTRRDWILAAYRARSDKP